MPPPNNAPKPSVAPSKSDHSQIMNNSKSKIVVVVDGGVVSRIYCDADSAVVTVLDYDLTDNFSRDELKKEEDKMVIDLAKTSFNTLQ